MVKIPCFNCRGLGLIPSWGTSILHPVLSSWEKKKCVCVCVCVYIYIYIYTHTILCILCIYIYGNYGMKSYTVLNFNLYLGEMS